MNSYWKKIVPITVMAVFFLLLPSSIEAKEQKSYLSQNFIDTLIQNAFYGFILASETMGNQRDQGAAILQAKKVAEKLRALAKDDPNRRYIMWRINELENQIYLEEEEVLLKKMYKRQKAVNKLVSQFNSIIGCWRPSFTKLVLIHERMVDIDPIKADELAQLIRERDYNISREVCYFLEKAFLANDYVKAEEEFSYILKNKKHLGIPGRKFSIFDSRIKAKREADDITNNIGDYVSMINDVISENQLSEGRHHIEILKKQITNSKPHLSEKNFNKFWASSLNLTKVITCCEDSLVSFNMDLLTKQGADVAIDYMDITLRNAGISIEKLMVMDQAIMAVPGKHQSRTDAIVTNELRSMEKIGSNSSFGFGDVSTRMKQKADSVQAEQEKLRIANDPAYAKIHKKEAARKKKKEKSRHKYAAKMRKHTVKIYTFLEDGKIEKAYSLFQKHSIYIKKYSAPDVFELLKMSVESAYKDMNATNKTPSNIQSKYSGLVGNND